MDGGVWQTLHGTDQYSLIIPPLQTVSYMYIGKHLVFVLVLKVHTMAIKSFKWPYLNMTILLIIGS